MVYINSDSKINNVSDEKFRSILQKKANIDKEEAAKMVKMYRKFNPDSDDALQDVLDNIEVNEEITVARGGD